MQVPFNILIFLFFKKNHFQTCVVPLDIVANESGVKTILHHMSVDQRGASTQAKAFVHGTGQINQHRLEYKYIVVGGGGVRVEWRRRCWGGLLHDAFVFFFPFRFVGGGLHVGDRHV